jgi:polysaccharide export outer membrane protein
MFAPAPRHAAPYRVRRAWVRRAWVRRAWVRRAWLALLCATSLAGCASPGADLPSLPTTDAAAYTLGPGDKLRIITFGEAQLTGQFAVDASGAISLPLVGSIQTTGLTPDALQNIVTDRLVAAKLYTHPSVSIEILSYRPVFVLGEVNRPGQYTYQPGMTVLTAAAIAGGFTYRAVEDNFSVVRETDGKPVEGRADRATTLAPGDVLTVYERRF